MGTRVTSNVHLDDTATTWTYDLDDKVAVHFGHTMNSACLIGTPDALRRLLADAIVAVDTIRVARHGLAAEQDDETRAALDDYRRAQDEALALYDRAFD